MRAQTRVIPLVALALLASSCGGSKGAVGPSPSASGEVVSQPALALAVLAAVGGHLDYCDPDSYPVGHGPPLSNAKMRIASIRADRATFQAILDFEHIASADHLTDEQLIAINEDFKQLRAIQLVHAGAEYGFTTYVPTAASPLGNEAVFGTVSADGKVAIDHRGPGQRKNCPICLAAGARIAVPGGTVAVQDLVVGARVWTADLRGARVLGVVLKTGHVSGLVGHEVVRVVLRDGRALTASAGHPTADGRMLGDLRVGVELDSSDVIAVTRLPYDGTTYDLLPSGPTGFYFADGVLMGSTLARAAAKSAARN